MNSEERLSRAQKKFEQYEHQQLLQQNRNKADASKIEFRRKVLIGEMFIKHFPIALQFTPGKSSNDDNQIFKPLDDYMEQLAKCQQAYRDMEDIVIIRQK